MPEADFSQWQRSNLERFARQAADENRELRRRVEAMDKPGVKGNTVNDLEAREQTIGPTILLSTGRYFEFGNPQPLSVEEIAHALSKLCRFTGHCSTFYSVAQHAVLVSRLVPREFALWGLHHDDVEAVVGDMSSPLKRLLPEYKLIEKSCEAAILAGLGLHGPVPEQVKFADLAALATEQRDLMSQRGGLWKCLDGIPLATGRVLPVPPSVAEQMFLDRHWELTRS